MQKMKSLMLLVLLSIGAYLPIHAQQGQGGRMRDMEPEEFAKTQTARMNESLTLTEEQLPKVEALNLVYAKKMKEVLDEMGDNREGMREKLRPMMKEKDTELKAILTDKQWATFLEIRQEQMQRRGGGRKRGI